MISSQTLFWSEAVNDNVAIMKYQYILVKEVLSSESYDSYGAIHVQYPNYDSFNAPVICNYGPYGARDSGA